MLLAVLSNAHFSIVLCSVVRKPFGAFHAPCFPGMTLLYLPYDVLKLMLTFLNPGLTFLNTGLTFLNPGLTFLRPGLRKVLLSHRHLGISQLSVSIHSSLSLYL